MRHLPSALVLSLLAMGACATTQRVSEPRRVTPGDVWSRLQRGDPVLLVCAYNAADCNGTHVNGSLTLEELRSRLDLLSRQQEIVFVCG